ncbi:hypothetical protein D3C72_1377600 [compost metagenome]
MVLLQGARQVTADQPAVHRMDEQRHHSKVHQKNLHEKRRAAKEAHIHGGGPAQQVLAHRLPGLVAGIGQARERQHQAKCAPHQDARNRHADRDCGTLPEQLLVFHQDIGAEPAEPFDGRVVIHTLFFPAKRRPGGRPACSNSYQYYSFTWQASRPLACAPCSLPTHILSYCAL